MHFQLITARLTRRSSSRSLCRWEQAGTPVAGSMASNVPSDLFAFRFSVSSSSTWIRQFIRQQESTWEFVHLQQDRTTACGRTIDLHNPRDAWEIPLDHILDPTSRSGILPTDTKPTLSHLQHWPELWRACQYSFDVGGDCTVECFAVKWCSSSRDTDPNIPVNSVGFMTSCLPSARGQALGAVDRSVQDESLSGGGRRQPSV